MSVRRRDVLAGVVGLTGAAHGAANGSRAESDEALLNQILGEVRSVREQYDARWRGIERIRAAQRTYLRATAKYPAFLEVGTDAWEAVHDWQVEYQQPIAMSRRPDGRYTLVFALTTLVLRPDMPASFIGDPTDTMPGSGE